MTSKLPNMVATRVKRSVGRPRKLDAGAVTYHIKLPLDLQHAIERHREKQPGLDGDADAVRHLLREAAEARKLVAPTR